MSVTFNKVAGDLATYERGGDVLATVRRSRSVAVDIETAGLGALAWDIKAVVIADTEHAHVLDPVADRGIIRAAIASASELIMHNSTFDAPSLVAAGLMHPAHVAKVWDTVVAARMALPGLGGRSLGQLCERFLGTGYAAAKDSLATAFRALTSKSKAQMFLDLGLESDAYVSYAGFDGCMTARLRQVLVDAVIAWTTSHPFKSSGDGAYLVEREQVVNRVLLAQTVTGITVDVDEVDRITDEMRQLVIGADALLAAYGIDVSLSRDLVKADAMRVLDQLGVIPARHPRIKRTGLPSADKKHLAKLNHPIVDALTTRSQATRFVEDYGDKLNRLEHDGRVHPVVAVMVAVTGRMSMANPPLQQYPPGVKPMLRWDHPVTSLDWKSIEPVLAGNFFGESEWIAGFEAGGDLYIPIAEIAGVDRATAKTTLLAQLYGQGAPGLSLRLNVTEERAREIVDAVFEPLDNVRRGINKVKAISDAYGKIQTLSGRIVPQPIDPKSGGRRFSGYIGINHVIQGSALDLLSEVIYAAHREGLADAIRLAVHDELVVDSDAADDFERLMSTPPPALCEMTKRTPVLRVGRAELGTNWQEKE